MGPNDLPVLSVVKPQDKEKMRSCEVQGSRHLYCESLLEVPDRLRGFGSSLRAVEMLESSSE